LKAVVLAAGEGVRMHPLTLTRPKCMLQAAGKPLLCHVLHRLKQAGISDATIVVRHHKEQVVDYFTKENLGMELDFVEQDERKGTAAALLSAKGKIEEDFLAVAGDVIADPEIYKAVMEAHDGKKTAAFKEVPDPKYFGIAELKGGKVASLEEKPENPKGNLANLSIYAFGPSIFQELEGIAPSPRGELELTEVLKGASAVTTDRFWMDVGYPWHLFDLNGHLLGSMDSKEGTVENSTIKGKLIMEEGAEVFDSFIEGTAYIGAGTKIGPHSYLRGNNSIGRNCSIGESTTIKNSILFDSVFAKHLSYIGDSIIGEGVNFGSGTQVANFRFDGKHMNVLTGKGWVNSGRRKLGVVVGDNTKFGVLSCTMPGKLIGPDCWVGSGVVVARNMPPGSRLFQKQEFARQGE